MQAVPESLLPSGVPDLQFDRLSTNIDHSGTKFHADGVVGVLFDCNKDAERRVKQSNLLWLSSWPFSIFFLQ